MDDLKNHGFNILVHQLNEKWKKVKKCCTANQYRSKQVKWEQYYLLYNYKLKGTYFKEFAKAVMQAVKLDFLENNEDIHT